MLPPFRVFWWNAARYVRRHRLLALANIFGIALGIAVYLAIQIANASANRSFEAGVDMVAGKAHLEMRGEVDERLWPIVAQQPAVAAVTGLLEAVVPLADRPGEYLRLHGVDIFTGAAFQTYSFRQDGKRLEPGVWLAQPAQVALTAELARRLGLKEGDAVRTVVEGRIETLTVFAIVEPGEVPIGDAHFAAMDLGWMQELVRRHGKLSSLQVQLRDPNRTEEAIAALQSVAPALSVAPPARRSAQVSKMLAAFQLNLSALSMVSLLVGVFLIYNTMSASVARRRVQIGIMRALGLSSLQVRVMFLGEALLYAIPGVVLGMIGGVLLSTVLVGAVEKTVSTLYALVSVDRIWLSPWQFVLAATYGVAAALVGAWGPAADAARVEPVAAMRRAVEKGREAAGTRYWWVAGLAVQGIGLLCGIWALHGGPRWIAFGQALCVLLAVAGFAPLFIRGCAAALASTGHRTLLPAARRLVGSLRRNAITAGALGSAVAMFIALVVMVFSFRQSLEAWLGKGLIADLFIAPAANDSMSLVSTLPVASVPWLRARPEVAAADTIHERAVTVDGQPTLMMVLEGEDRENLTFVAGDARAAMARMLAGDAVVVTEPFARRFRVQLGSRISIATPQGPQELPIAGVYADYARDQGILLVGQRWMARHWDDVRPMSIAVYLKPGASAATLDTAFRQHFADQGQFAVRSSRELQGRVMKIFDQTFTVTEVLRTVAVVVAVAGVFLTMTTMVIERRRELALIRALGASPGYLGGMVLAEAGMLGLVSALLGVAAGLPLAMVLTWVVNPAFFGWTIHFSIPWLALLATPVWVSGVAVLAAWWPARVARTVEIAEALHEE